MLIDLMHRMRSILRRKTVENELDDELQFHFEHEVEKQMNLGLSRVEAMRRARLAFGGMDQVKEECRQARGITALVAVAQDLRLAVRGMRRNPTFAVVAILTLGLGTGAIATIFTLANTFFFRKLPVENPDEVVVVQATRRHGQVSGWVGYPDYVSFRDGAKTLQDLAAHYSTAPLFVTTENQAREINGAVVSANFFPLLGVRPASGRFFRPDEDQAPDRDAVAVLGYDLWRNWFGSSPDVFGTTLKINGVAFTVIGVAPQEFRGVSTLPAEIYIPTMMLRVGYRWCEDSLASDCTVLDMIGRLADGRTLEDARAEVATLVPRSWRNAPEGENTGATVFRARGASLDLPSQAAVRFGFVKLLGWIAALLLLVCCANLAGLLIARNSARSREFAIRVSLGAGRMRIVGQLMTESLLLGVLGGVAGVLLSRTLTATLTSMFYALDAEGHPLYFDFTLEPVVILAVVGVSVAAGLVVGVIPAMNCIRAGTAESLKRQSPAVSADARWGRWLVGAQTAVAVALMAIAGLLGTSAHTLLSGINFEPSRVALMRLRPRLISYAPEKAQRFLRTVISRLEALAGVESVSMVGTGVVLLGGGAQVSLPATARALECGYIEIGSRYFETLRTPMLRGRGFDDHDTARSTAVAIVNETLARRFWPTGSVVGASVIINEHPHQVVGVVGDVPLDSRDTASKPYVYVPYWQNPAQIDARLCVRVTGDPAATLPLLVDEVHRVDPDVPIAETITLPLQLAGFLRPARMSATFVAYAGALAVLLCALGLYGAMAFSVSRRTREIGIRMAMGAQSGTVLRMVFREGMKVILVGVGVGLGLAVAGTTVVRHLLYGSGGSDPVVYAAGGVFVACVGLFACWIPARRAASIEPISALREE